MELINKILGFGLPCMFHFITGLYCPGCGGTRSVKYLLSGQLLKSIQYHPIVIYGVVILGLFAVSYGLNFITNGRTWKMRYHHAYTYGAVVIVAANCIIKNYMLIVKGIDLLP